MLGRNIRFFITRSTGKSGIAIFIDHTSVVRDSDQKHKVDKSRIHSTAQQDFVVVT